MSKWVILICLLFMNPLTASSVDIQEIYSRLCKSLQVSGSLIPSLEIRTLASSGASYSKQANKIYLDKKLIDAVSVLGSQREAALAFIIGHELCHALEKDKHDTHFLAYDKAKDATYMNEQNADIQGAFVAYLAGYNCLPSIGETIELIYKTYNLKSDLKGYPSKGDRIESVYIIREQVESLIAIFKSANLLMLHGNYSLAAALFEKLAVYFPSPEVSNNIGTNILLEALNLGSYNYFKYSLPIEISYELRLNKPSLAPGKKDFEPEIIRKREILFRKADIIYKNLLQQQADYFPTWNNLICLKILQGDLVAANSFLQKANKSFLLDQDQESLYLLAGMIKLLENKRPKALEEFKKIKHPWLKSLAELNLQKDMKAKPSPEICKPDIQLSSNPKSPLLQEKTIKMDSILISWTYEKILIKTPNIKKEFKMVNVRFKENPCVPIQSFNQAGAIWSPYLVSIYSGIEKKPVFYSIID